MAPSRPKVLSRPRLCDSRAQTRVLAAGLVAGVWRGRNRVAKTRSYTGVLFLLLSFLEGGVKYLIGWQVELLARLEQCA